MEIFTDLIFYTGFSLLLVHELDAIKRQEWRIFPVLSSLKDKTAYILYVSLHIPLFIIFFFLLTNQNEYIRYWFRIGLDLFFIVHMVLHYLFSSHKEYKFTGTFSKLIICMMAAFGALHIILTFDPATI